MFNFLKKKIAEKEEIIQNDEFPTEEELDSERFNNFCFKLNRVEAWRYLDFCKRHRECVSGKFGAIGGGISVEITPTGLGNLVRCKCKGCGKQESITNIDNW